MQAPASHASATPGTARPHPRTTLACPACSTPSLIAGSTGSTPAYCTLCGHETVDLLDLIPIDAAQPPAHLAGQRRMRRRAR